MEKFTEKSLVAIVIFFLLGCQLYVPAAFADEDEVQVIGGLRFDMDEGVKIEKGPGGSVYVKSNREYMREKFAMLEERIAGLENKIKSMEKTLYPELFVNEKKTVVDNRPQVLSA